MSLEQNADRFSGFADLYDAVRPTPPQELASVITRYAGGDGPALVVDLGCGTGLSTRWAAGWAQQVIGVEPSDDMRVRAAAVTELPNVRYVAGWSNSTDLADGSADIVLAVQALHWMEPASTFTEVARILRPGGVFAALDCDWPPSVCNAAAEQAWTRRERGSPYVNGKWPAGQRILSPAAVRHRLRKPTNYVPPIPATRQQR